MHRRRGPRRARAPEQPPAPSLWASPPSGLHGPHLEAAGLQEDRTGGDLCWWRALLLWSTPVLTWLCFPPQIPHGAMVKRMHIYSGNNLQETR